MRVQHLPGSCKVVPLNVHQFFTTNAIYAATILSAFWGFALSSALGVYDIPYWRPCCRSILTLPRGKLKAPLVLNFASSTSASWSYDWSVTTWLLAAAKSSARFSLTGIQFVHFPVPGIALLSCVVLHAVVFLGLFVCCVAALSLHWQTRLMRAFRLRSAFLQRVMQICSCSSDSVNLF